MKFSENPFYVLKVSSTTSKREIEDRVDDLIFDEPENEKVYREALSILVHPQKRLLAEVAWFCGIDQSVQKLTRMGDDGPYILMSLGNKEMKSLLSEGNWLPQVNLLANKMCNSTNIDELFNCLIKIDQLFDLQNTDAIFTAINLTREQAGINAVLNIDALKEALRNRLNEIKVYISTLNIKLNQEDYIFLVNKIAEQRINVDKDFGEFVDFLIEDYTSNTSALIDVEQSNILGLVEKIKNIDDEKLAGLHEAVKHFDWIAQPIQLALRFKGLPQHNESENVASSLRLLSLHFNNDLEKPEVAMEISKIISECFSELPHVESLVECDKEALEGIIESKIDEEVINTAIDALKNIVDEIDKNIVHKEGNTKSNKLYCENHFPEFMDTMRKYVDPAKYSADGSYKIIMRIAVIVYRRMAAAWTWGNDFIKADEYLRMALPFVDYLASNNPTSEDLESKKSFYEDINKYKIDADTQRIEVQKFAREGLIPISSAPSLSTINGCGLRLYGRDDIDPGNGSYLATYYFVFLFIPIIPLNQYRVISHGNSYQFLGKKPLEGFKKIWRNMAIIVAIVLGINAMWPTASTKSYTSTKNYTSTTKNPTNNTQKASNYQQSKPVSSQQPNKQERIAVLKSKLSSSETQLKQMESQLKKMESEGAEIDRQMKNRDMNSPRYNLLFDKLNAKYGDYKTLYSKYKNSIAEHNKMVDEYNRLIKN